MLAHDKAQVLSAFSVAGMERIARAVRVKLAATATHLLAPLAEPMRNSTMLSPFAGGQDLLEDRARPPHHSHLRFIG